ncbi:hypothetical protein F9K50_00990 [bacterium]|nr:MAG: hypothetical protein F9K50_00990 [bacterium]
MADQKSEEKAVEERRVAEAQYEASQFAIHSLLDEIESVLEVMDQRLSRLEGGQTQVAHEAKNLSH